MQLGLGLGLTRIGGGSSLARLLFSNNEPGFTFEPWDMTTLYQDRAGTTPVTAAGQSVGLRLDKSKGLALGPELVANGDFSAGSAGWTLFGTGWSIASGLLSGSAAPANDYGPYQNATSVVEGVTYKATYTITVTTGGVAVRVGNTQSSTYTSSGTYTQYFVAISTGVTVFQPRAGGSGFTGTIDNISVRELAGNHQVAISDAKRGVYGWMPKTGKRNLLTFSEQFDDAAWDKTALSGVTQNTTAGPNDEVTADKLVEDATYSVHRVFQVATATASTTYTASVYVKAAERFQVRLMETSLGGANFDLSTGVVSGQGAGITGTITPVGGGWYRCAISGSTGAAQTIFVYQIQMGDAAPSFSPYQGDGVSGLYVAGAQLEVGSTATAYQRVNSQYDVTEAGVQTCYYVQADGVDDAYVTPTITPNTDKVQVFAGVRRLSNATAAIVAELSTHSDNISGSFSVWAPSSNGGTQWYMQSRGNVLTDASASGYAAPVSNVFSGLTDISGDSLKIRVNGAQVAESTADQGTGNYLAYPAYIYARAGTTFPFNGLDFGHAVRFGPNLDAATIARVEALIARNTPEVTL